MEGLVWGRPGASRHFVGQPSIRTKSVDAAALVQRAALALFALLGLAEAVEHYSGEEGVDHLPAPAHLLRVGLPEDVLQGHVQRLAQHLPVALADAVADVPPAQLGQHRHESAEVAQACDGAPDGVDHLAEEVPEAGRLHEVRRVLVLQPLAIPHPDLDREGVHGLRREGEDVLVQEAADGNDAVRLHFLPTRLDARQRGRRQDQALRFGRNLNRRLRAAQWAPSGGRRPGGRRPGGRRRRRARGAVAGPGVQRQLVLPQPPLELHHVATGDAHLLQIEVVDEKQGLHVVEAMGHQRPRVLLQADVPQECDDGVVGAEALLARCAVQLGDLPAQEPGVEGQHAQVLDVLVLDGRQRLHVVEAGAQQSGRVHLEPSLKEEGAEGALLGRGPRGSCGEGQRRRERSRARGCRALAERLAPHGGWLLHLRSWHLQHWRGAPMLS
mmetsp:Transcript_96296/g.267594  ORF Transcript_96296/g.267594 Transcript_96296/m.267594 type:complete len:441 (-) Transcript_96296:20-1342(-)